MLKYAAINMYPNMKIKFYKRAFILLEINPKDNLMGLIDHSFKTRLGGSTRDPADPGLKSGRVDEKTG